jgi:VanZ family protein
MRKFVLYWLPVLAWMGFIFFWSARPAITASAVDWQDFTVKKTAHIVEYFLLGILVFRAFKGATRMASFQALVTIVWCGVYAISDELHQSFIPGRTATIRDVLIDLAGSSLGSFLTQAYNRA